VGARGGRWVGAARGGEGAGEVIGGAAVVTGAVAAWRWPSEGGALGPVRAGGVRAEALEDVPGLGGVVGIVLDVDEEGVAGAGRVGGGIIGEKGRGGGGGAGRVGGRRGGGRAGGEEELDVGDEVVGVVGREGEDGVGKPFGAGGVDQLVLKHDRGLVGRGQLRLEEGQVGEHAVDARDGGFVG